MSAPVMLGPEPPPPPPPAAVKTERPLGSALFWGEGDAIDPDDPDMAALLALQEETPPEERAEAFKDRGNESLRLGTPFHVRQASACYTQALEQGSSDVCANSTYLANRAQAQLLLKNWGRALADGRLALSLNPGNLKAAWRAAKAAAELGRHEEVEQLCAAGLQREPAHGDLLRLQAAAGKARLAAAAAAQRVQAAVADVQRLATALEQRGLRFGPQRFGGADRKPRLDEDGCLCLRMVLMYPESKQTDLIEEMSEQDCLADHLDAMFGPDAPSLPWDEQGEYTRERLELFYQTALVAPYSATQLRRWLAEGTPAAGALAAGEEESAAVAVDAPFRLVRVDQAAPLAQALAGDGHVIPGTVVLFVLARGTQYAKLFQQHGLTDESD